MGGVREIVGRVRERMRCWEALNWGKYGFSKKWGAVRGKDRVEASEAERRRVDARVKGSGLNDFRRRTRLAGVCRRCLAAGVGLPCPKWPRKAG